MIFVGFCFDVMEMDALAGVFTSRPSSIVKGLKMSLVSISIVAMLKAYGACLAGVFGCNGCNHAATARL